VTTPKDCPPVPSLNFPALAIVPLRKVIGGLVVLCVGLGSLSLPVPAFEDKNPKNDYALIFGTVWGPDSRPIYGIKVKIRRANEKKARWELYSDHNGEFAQRVPVGRQDYLVWADLKGIKLQNGKALEQGTEVPVHIEFNERADIGLHLK
jgi:hypothetical protein